MVRHAQKWSIYDRAVERGILPSMRIRWCCADFKETAGAGKVTLIGIRKQESVRRSKRHEVEVSNKKFSGDLKSFFDWQKKEIARKEEKLIRKMKREGKKVNEDEFSLATDNEVRCINGKDSILISPIFDWSESDVWYFLNDILGVPHCELYDKGYKRIGCILCPMSSARQKKREEKDYPHVKRKWIEAIKAIRRGGGLDSQPFLYGGTSGRTGHSLRPTADSSNTGITPPLSGETRFCNSETGNAPSSTGERSSSSRISSLLDAPIWCRTSLTSRTLEQGCQQRYLERGFLPAHPLTARWMGMSGQKMKSPNLSTTGGRVERHTQSGMLTSFCKAE